MELSDLFLRCTTASYLHTENDGKKIAVVNACNTQSLLVGNCVVTKITLEYVV